MADAVEILKSWPGWLHAGVETILASPAWRFEVRAGDSDGTLQRIDEMPTDILHLSVTFDGTPAILSLADSEAYPDLHLLWARRAELPSAVLLALIEKECTPLFALLEAATRRQFSLVQVVANPTQQTVGFKLDGLSAPLLFALELPAEIAPTFGCLENLDPTHPTIATATRPAWIAYETLAVTAADCAALQAGDLVLRTATDATPHWSFELPQDDVVHVMSRETTDITFADVLAHALPPLPETTAWSLVQAGRVLADVEPAQIGEAGAVRLTERKS